MKIDSCLLVGCGGIGSLLIEPLTRLLTYHPNGTDHFIVVEADRVEPRNLTRQLFPNNQLWRSKSLAISRKLNTPNISFIDKYINEGNVVDILSILPTNNSLIIAAVDNAATRKLLLETADDLLESYVWISPSNEYSTVQTSIYIKNSDPPFIHPLIRYSNLQQPDDKIPGGCYDEQPSSPQLITANNLAAHFTLQYVTCLLDEHPVYPELIGDIYNFKFSTVGTPALIQ